MEKKYLFQKSKNIFICTVLLFIVSMRVSAQCSFTGAEASPRETITFCIDNSNTVVTSNTYTAGQYVAVNVVKGFNYTFSYPDAFATQNITLFNSLNTLVSLASNSSTTAVSLTWNATFSGVVYALISRGNCNNSGNANNGQVTITLNSVGNTQDSQTTFGTNQWVGHVYNWTGSTPPGGTSAATPSSTVSPFTNANYVGYYNIASETINEGFGGNTSCFSVLSNGVSRTSIYTELFAVRYRMKSTRAAGCYFLNVNGDDGVRVYVDNVLVFDQWKEQGNTSYCNNLIYLNGNSDIVLDYYENAGGNVVGFSLTPFNGTTNTISSATDVVVCSGSSAGLIDGSAFGSCGGGTNTIYQWQVSTDNVTFTDVTGTGANSEDYTPPTFTTTSSSIIRYYRRVLKAFASNAASCSFNSASVKVTTNPSVKNFTTAPTSSTCPNTDVTYTTQSGMTNYVWTIPGSVGTDYSITSGSLGTTSNTVTLKWLTSGSKTVTANYTSTCSGTTAATNTTTVVLGPNNVSNGFSASTICVGDTAKLTFDADDTGFVGPYTITYKNNASATIYTVTIPTAAATSFTPGDNPTSNQSYTLLSIANATCTRTTGFGSSGASLIVRALPTATISGTTTVCQGATSPNITFTNPQTATITVTYNINGGTNATLDVAAATAAVPFSVTIAAPTTVSGAFNYNLTKVEYKSLSTCSSLITGSNAVITVNSLSVAPTTISGTTTICSGSSTTLTVSGGTIGGGAVVNWYTGSCGGTLVGTGTSITVSPTANTTYYVRYEGTCSTTSCISTTVTVNPIISNNSLSFTNGTSGQASATPAENANAILTAPAGTYFSTVNFTSYGTPTGTAPNFVIGSCNASTSRSVVETLLLGNGTTSIPATNAAFGDPCNGTLKRLYVLASYVEPLCSGASAVLNGSTPTGGTGLYTYLWESSTTSPTTGFSAAAGTNNLINYTSGALTQTTYFRRVVTSCSYTSTSAVVMVKVNPVISGNTVPASQTICSGSTPSTLIASTPTGGSGTYTYTWQSSTTSATAGFTTATGTSNAKDYSPGALSTSTWFRRVVNSGTCVDTSAVTLITTTTTAVPTIGTVTQPTCAIPTGTINLGGLPATGTWTLTRYGTTTSTTTGTGTTITISGLPADSYSFTVSASSCVSASTASVPINALITTTYNGTSWSVTPPTSDMNGVVSASGTIANDVDLCSCTVNNGVIATVASGVMLRLQNELQVLGTGSLTFKDDSSLVQINDNALNSGSIFYERETTPITNFDYTYWSAPVAGQKLIDFAPTTLGDKFLSFDSFVNNWKYENAYTTFMSKGTGYIIRGPQPKSGLPPSTQLYKFTGAPNNGVVSLPIGPLGNSVLIGNPYPSALDADKFLDANAAFLEGTIYFWTHNTSLRLASSLSAGTAGSGSYAYTSDDYAAYNRTGGVATYAAPSASSSLTPTATSGPIVSTNAPTSTIGAGQSFFATSKAAGNVQFNNSMRVGYTAIVANSNSQFFKTASTKKTVSTIDKNRIWLDLTNDEGAFKETLLGYITSATNSNESAFDGETYDANAFLDFYSINEEKNLAIQGRALPFDDTDVIPLGYRSAIAGEFSINIRDKDGFFTNQKVYLEDKLLDTVFDLSEGTYKFTTAIGTFNERFAILYSNKTLGVDDVDPITKGVFISTKDKIITIVTGEETITAAYVYDLAGKQLFAKKAIDTNQMTITNLPATNVVLVVKVVLADGSVLTQKIVY